MQAVADRYLSTHALQNAAYQALSKFLSTKPKQCLLSLHELPWALWKVGDSAATNKLVEYISDLKIMQLLLTAQHKRDLLSYWSWVVWCTLQPIADCFQ
jgi:hypothetical protein